MTGLYKTTAHVNISRKIPKHECLGTCSQQYKIICTDTYNSRVHLGTDIVARLVFQARTADPCRFHNSILPFGSVRTRMADPFLTARAGVKKGEAEKVSQLTMITLTSHTFHTSHKN